MLIAIIDDGIRNNVYGNFNIRYDLSVDRDGTITRRVQNDVVLTEHGTMCAAIIAKYAPNAEFCSLRIFHQPQLHASCEQLISALEWCLEKKLPIVHLSIGTHLLSDYSEIQTIVGRMLHQNQIIVAACNNNGMYSIPASLGGVIGVVADNQLLNGEYRIGHSPQKQPIVFASSKHSLLLLSAGSETTQITNSYAAPTVTAHIHNILQNVKPFSLTSAVLLQKLGGTALFPYNHPDYIADAYIINPDHHPLLHKHLYFRNLGEYEKLTDLKQNSHRKDIVYLAPQKPDFRNRDYCWLIENADCYGNLLYGGVIPLPYVFALGGKLTWSEVPIINTQAGNDIDNAGIDVPIVYIYGSEVESLYLACELRNLFFLDGYQCLCISNWRFSYLYNVEFTSKIGRRANNYRYYCADIIICCFHNKPCREPKCGEEYSIVLNESITPASINHRWSSELIASVIDDKAVLQYYKEIVSFFNRPDN